jgi:hypothetical protein
MLAESGGVESVWNVVEDGNDVINGDVPDGFCRLDYGQMEEFSGLGRGFCPCVNSFVPCCYSFASSGRDLSLQS